MSSHGNLAIENLMHICTICVYKYTTPVVEAPFLRRSYESLIDDPDGSLYVPLPHSLLFSSGRRILMRKTWSCDL
ncbi:hypothetical protein A0H81_06730 [Grifola frondosa]|uniref:Uncharacterized protein n=1 Tax=Grifola frondosa TaxID=5627 RepID=A0A1C7M7T1_GRIFR|nr:hypothetical protein A0H81_08996 [Grifola frondosa]OBZ72888.1 hypothetical protein A0H81_06730 [Grifola frondosa]